jgi:hypothetical protein
MSSILPWFYMVFYWSDNRHAQLVHGNATALCFPLTSVNNVAVLWCSVWRKAFVVWLECWCCLQLFFTMQTLCKANVKQNNTCYFSRYGWVQGVVLYNYIYVLHFRISSVFYVIKSYRSIVWYSCEFITPDTVQPQRMPPAQPCWCNFGFVHKLPIIAGWAEAMQDYKLAQGSYICPVGESDFLYTGPLPYQLGHELLLAFILPL